MTDTGQFEYPDGSTPPVDENGQPILEDRSADFPDEAAEATELVGEPVIVTRDGRQHFLGPGSGMSGYRGLAAKRAEKRAEPEEPTGEVEREQGQDGTQDAPEGSGTDDDTSEVENGPENVDQGSSGEAGDSGTASDAGEESGDEDSAENAGDDTPADDEEPADEGYDPFAHTVAEVTAYLDENPDQATYVLDRERTGKARVSLIGA